VSVRWLSSRIPPISAFELGVFRVLFGAALAWVVHVLRLPPEPFPRELHLTVHQLAQWEWVHRLAANYTFVSHLEDAVIALALLFAVGALTRVSYSALLITVTMWTLIRLMHTGAHNWSALFVTLWALWPVRWGDGFSVDALVRRIRGTRLTDVRRTDFGYAPWMCGLVFGTAMAGAGVAKLSQAGLSWITNASIKYHFVIDAGHAATDWGLWVAGHHPVALLMSAAAIATECGLVFAVLVKRWLWRLPFALAGLGLLVSFHVFQGELWLAWWLLFAAFFVPWANLVRLFRRREATTAAGLLSQVQMVMIVAVCTLQIVASYLRIEVAPIMSDYPMYATTYASIDEFERRNAIAPRYHFAVRFADGQEVDANQVFDQLQLEERIRDAYLRISEGKQPESKYQDTVVAVTDILTAHFGRPVTAVVVLIDQQAFDWTQGRFYWKAKRQPVHTFVR
jgi:hypothetical protein